MPIYLSKNVNASFHRIYFGPAFSNSLVCKIYLSAYFKLGDFMFLTFIKILSTKEQSSQNNLLFVSVFSNISSLLNIYERVFCEKSHCVKSVLIRSFSGPYFSAFGLNMERHGVSFRIQSEFGKVRTRNTPNINTFHSVNNWLKAGKKLYHRSLTGTLTNSFSMHPFSTP